MRLSLAGSALQPPDGQVVAEVAAALGSADRSLIVVGGSAWADADVACLAELVAAEELPFATAFRRQDLVANTAAAYAGAFGPLSTVGLAERARRADVVLLLGTRPDEQTAARWLDELAIGFEASARVGAARLPFRARWAVLAAAGIYGAIGREVVRRGDRAWD